MLAIQYSLFLRFLRLRVWILALVFPALLSLFLASGAGEGGPAARAARGVLLWLEWGLPSLALLFLLTSSGEARRDLVLLAPCGWPGFVLGRFLGAAALFGGCHLLMASVLASSLAVAGGGPEGRVDREPEERLAGMPGNGGRPAEALLRPWPSGRADPRWLSEVEACRSWSFVFGGLPPGKPCTARVRAFIARVLTEEEGGRARRDLARARSAPAGAGFLDAGGRTVPIGTIELADASPVTIAVPAGAVDARGRLTVILSRVEEVAGETGGVKWGPRFFWFDPSGADPSSVRDLRIDGGGISFAGNALRASLAPLGALLLACGLGAAASALFSPGIAFGMALTVFLLSSSKGFLAAILGSLERRSALELLSDPSAPGHLLEHAPTWFDRGLALFLRSFLAILPDYGSFRAGRFLAAGTAVPPAAIAGAIGLGALVAAVFLALALVLPARKEGRP